MGINVQHFFLTSRNSSFLTSYLAGKCGSSENRDCQISKLLVHEAGTGGQPTDELGIRPELGFTIEKDHELPFFSFSTIEMATDHFSDANKLGQGGFGIVYKVYTQKILINRKYFIN